ncbi:hypothetical protein VaNZ11_013662 [Volvox africanus]|uniref:Uncharacterized protein n=1 Tax=Volvox africanus TaxID=51714 RepID=A0ABQ5SHI5_9CHLO|nr:hypothetical protein VaNZ11_013662 [Volvox africanus]
MRLGPQRRMRIGLRLRLRLRLRHFRREDVLQHSCAPVGDVRREAAEERTLARTAIEGGSRLAGPDGVFHDTIHRNEREGRTEAGRRVSAIQYNFAASASMTYLCTNISARKFGPTSYPVQVAAVTLQRVTHSLWRLSSRAASLFQIARSTSAETTKDACCVAMSRSRTTWSRTPAVTLPPLL